MTPETTLDLSQQKLVEEVIENFNELKIKILK